MSHTRLRNMPYKESIIQRKKRLAKARLKRQNESFIEKQLRLELRRSARFERLLEEPLEERFFRQYIDKIRAQDRRKSETPEQRASRIEKCRIHAHVRKHKPQVCDVCRRRYYPHEVTKYNRATSQNTLLRELQESKEELILCYNCNYDQAEWSGLDQPSCSSLADSEQLLTEDQQQLEPETMLVEIKEEIPWEDQNCTRAMEPAQEDVQRIPVELMRGEDPVTAALQRMRGEMSELARADQLSAGLNQLRADIGTLARGDEFDAFGRYVASLLRNMRPRRAQHAQPVIINLLAAEMIKKDDDET